MYRGMGKEEVVIKEKCTKFALREEFDYKVMKLSLPLSDFGTNFTG